jgi:hypothetical protein
MAPSLTRGRVYSLLLFLGLGSAGPGPAGLKPIFHCPNFLDSPNLEDQVPVFISPRSMVALALGSFPVASYDSQGIPTPKQDVL